MHYCGVQEMVKLQLNSYHLSQNQYLKARAATTFSCSLKDLVMAKPRLLLNRPIPATEESLHQQKESSLMGNVKGRALIHFSPVAKKDIYKNKSCLYHPFGTSLFHSSSWHGYVVEDGVSSAHLHAPIPVKARLTWLQVALQFPKHECIPNSAGEAEPSFWQGLCLGLKQGGKNPQWF